MLLCRNYTNCPKISKRFGGSTATRSNLLRNSSRQYGYTQQFVAEQLGITPQSYHAYEAGITIPTLPNFIKLARLYDVSLDDLLE